MEYILMDEKCALQNNCAHGERSWEAWMENFFKGGKKYQRTKLLLFRVFFVF
jgi:hypothetical protein